MIGGNIAVQCSNCGSEHPRADVIEEAKRNGWPVDNITLPCRTCGGTITVRQCNM